MPRCPNPKCNYPLVFLEARGKYKCPLCGKLYIQKEIDSGEFLKYNEQQKIKDKEMLKEEYKAKAKELKELKKAIKSMFKKDADKDELKAKAREYYSKNNYRILEWHDNWKETNRERFSLTKKKWNENNKVRIKQLETARRHKNLGLNHLNQRLNYLRKKQLKLADEILQNGSIDAAELKQAFISPT